MVIFINLPSNDLEDSWRLKLILTHVLSGEPLYPRGEHAHGELGPAGGHGVPVVPFHGLHDG